MPKFKKRYPLIVDATQVTQAMLNGETPLPKGVKVAVPEAGGTPFLYVEHKDRGRLVVEVGDWVITDARKITYPCKNNVFIKAYEPYQEPVKVGSVGAALIAAEKSQANQE